MLDVESPVGTWFGTDFDEPPPTLSVPGVLAGGQEPALRASDHFVRGHRVVGRFGAAESMIGLKVRAGGLPVRVTAHLRLDSAALTWWAERADPRAVAAAAGPERPRLVLVSSQGRPRGAALLARARVGAQAVDARAVVAFDLAAEEVPDDGLLLLDATDPTPRLPGWAAAGLLPAAPVGLRVDTVTVDRPAPGPELLDRAAAERRGLAGAGGLVGDSAGPPRTPYLVLNPRRSDAELRVRVRPLDRAVGSVQPPAAAGRAGAVSDALGRVWRGCAGRALRHTSPAMTADSLGVRAVSLVDGRELPVRVAIVDGDLDITVAPGVGGPVLAHVAPVGGPRRGRAVVCQVVEAHA